MPDRKEEKKKERVSIFIDGSNLYHGLKVIGMSINDFERFANLIAGDRDLRRVFYYTAIMDRDFNEKGFIKQQKFLRKLSSIPKFKLVYCTFKKIMGKNGNIRYEVKGDDVQLANDMLVGAYENRYDTAVLVSGDEDFKPVVRTIKRLGKRVENIFFRGGSSSRLRKTCDLSKNIRFILEELKRRPSIIE